MPSVLIGFHFCFASRRVTLMESSQVETFIELATEPQTAIRPSSQLLKINAENRWNEDFCPDPLDVRLRKVLRPASPRTDAMHSPHTVIEEYQVRNPGLVPTLISQSPPALDPKADKRGPQIYTTPQTAAILLREA